MTAFGEVLTINTDSSSIMVNSFGFEVSQQDAYVDNISFTDNNGTVNQTPTLNIF